MLTFIRPCAFIKALPRSTFAFRSIQREFTSAAHQPPPRPPHLPRRPVRDTSYPFPLYLHPLPMTTTTVPTPDYALSFLPIYPEINSQVIGYLKTAQLQHDLANLEEGERLIKPTEFTENEAFNKVLHEVIQMHLAKDPMVISVLQQQLEGWTHIADYRNPAPYGRIPLPEDIFGSVQVVDGVIQPSTYQRMPTHRIVSSLGLFQLSDYIHEKLVGYLQEMS